MTPNGIETTAEWKAHDYEAWIVACDRHDMNLIYSGGDDGLFRIWDIRQQPDHSVVTNKHHQMGVTAMQSHPTTPGRLVTGSYDEGIRLWDQRQWKRPLMEIQMSGGIWRLKWHSLDPSMLLTACMHGGFHVVRVGEGGMEIETSFLEHQSLAYGVDWLTDGKAVSCSFYDHAMHMWSTAASSSTDA